MKEDLRNVFLMGLGAMSLSTDKAREMKEDLLKRGEKLYDEGKVANEELKHNIKETIKDNVTVIVKNEDVTKEKIVETIKSMSEDEKKQLLSLLKEEKETKKKDK